MHHKEFIFSTEKKLKSEGSVAWKAPSNIALIKYWGKHGNQLPANPSLSFTLSNSNTQTKLSYKILPKKTAEVQFQIFFEGKLNESFRPKIESFFKKTEDYIPFIREYSFEIHTKNTFPHSSGIASSASGMAALALCLMSLEKELNPELTEEEFHKKASFLARLGSGSAARSIEGPVCVWGKHPVIDQSSDLYAVPSDFEAAEIFKNFQDTILLVDEGEKTVSSTAGHNLMIGHPFAKNRFDQAFVNLDLLKQAMQTGNMEEFIKIVESEALTLHAMMMTSSPYYLLMKPNTLAIIQKLWKFRKKSKASICFTLDAGANVHVLYPHSEKEVCLNFIRKELAPLCQNGNFITDQVGSGAEKSDL